MERIKHIQEPKEKKGLFVITYIDDNCNEWTAHTTEIGLKVAKLKDKFKELKYDTELICEFEDAIREELREDDSYNV